MSDTKKYHDWGEVPGINKIIANANNDSGAILERLKNPQEQGLDPSLLYLFFLLKTFYEAQSLGKTEEEDIIWEIMGNIFKEPDNFINAFIGGPLSGAFATVNLLNAFLAAPGERTQEEIEKFFDLFNHTTNYGCIRTQMTSVASLGRVILNPRFLLDEKPSTLRAAEFLKNSTDKLIEAMFYMLPLQGKNDRYPENLQKLAEVFAKFALETIAKDQLSANAAAWTKIFLPYLVPVSRDNAFTKFLDGEGIACKRFTLDTAPQIVCDITANNYFTSAFVKAFDNYMSQENPQISPDTFNKLKILIEEDRKRLNLPPSPARTDHEFIELSPNEIEQPHARIIGEQAAEAADMAAVTPAIENHQEEREVPANPSHTSKINKTIDLLQN